MVWHQTGDKPISKPMVTKFNDTYMVLGGDKLTLKYGDILGDHVDHFEQKLWWMKTHLTSSTYKDFFLNILSNMVVSAVPLFPGHHPHLMMMSSNGNIFRFTGPLWGESTVHQWIMWSFDVFFDLHLNKWLSKQSGCWWFEMPWHSLGRHWNVVGTILYMYTSSIWKHTKWNHMAPVSWKSDVHVMWYQTVAYKMDLSQFCKDRWHLCLLNITKSLLNGNNFPVV